MKVQNPEKKQGTVLFCDIRNFTHLFEDKDPFEAVEFANNVLAVLGEVVEDWEGTVDRFTGDGFLAHYGFSNGVKNHAEQACRTAIAIRERLKDINADRYFKIESVVTVGIGIHTGTAAYCKIQTKQLEQITVLGDTVNTASRIEELTKYFLVDALVSEETKNEVKERFLFQKMPLKTIKGKNKPVQTYWFLPTNTNK